MAIFGRYLGIDPDGDDDIHFGKLGEIYKNFSCVELDKEINRRLREMWSTDILQDPNRRKAERDVNELKAWRKEKGCPGPFVPFVTGGKVAGFFRRLGGKK
jgi:hypothetical protein